MAQAADAVTVPEGKIPRTPSDEEREDHEKTHAIFQS